MIRLQPSGWKMAKLFAGSTRVLLSEADQVVRLFDAPSRSPATPIEMRVDAVLRQSGPVSVGKLVKKVAADLYIDELHSGAGVLDIGLFGDRLFERDVLREVKAANGILWKIESQRETA